MHTVISICFVALRTHNSWQIVAATVDGKSLDQCDVLFCISLQNLQVYEVMFILHG